MATASVEASVVDEVMAEDAAPLSTHHETGDTIDSADLPTPLVLTGMSASRDGTSKGSEKKEDGALADDAPASAPPNDDETIKPLTNDKGGVREDSDAEADSEDDLENHFRDTLRRQASRLTTNGLYDVYVSRLGENKPVPAHGEEQKNKSKAPAMVRGVIDYARTLEERILRLETAEAERLKAVKEGRTTTTDDSKTNDGKETDLTNEWGDLVLQVKFFHADGEFDNAGEWLDNLHKRGSYQCNLDPKHLIRVLYNWADGIVPKRLDGGEHPDPNDVDILTFGIMSEPIASFFTKRLGLTADKSNLVRIGKPFRPLIRNLKLLRDQLARLETKFGAIDAQSGESSTETASMETKDAVAKGSTDSVKQADVLPFPATSENETKETERFETAESLVHFRHLFEFVDKYLAKQLALYERLQEGVEDKIAFENLWMLFDTGDRILCPSHGGGNIMMPRGEDPHIIKPRYVPQLFSVLGTRGGLPRRKTLAPRRNMADQDVFGDSFLSEFFMKAKRSANLQQETSSGSLGIPSYRRTKDSFTPLSVVCFHIDFDGVKYGTVREIFVLKPHDGLVDIKGLEIFPIQYPKPEPGRPLGRSEESGADKFLQRGRKFIKVTAVSHMSYEGLTVGKSREEINSAVIVDFKLSFQEYEDAFLPEKNVVPRLTSLVGSWPPTHYGEVFEFTTNSCDDVWCHNAECLVEQYDSFYPKQAEKIESKIKGLIDDYEVGKLYQEYSLEVFQQYMEDNELIMLLPGVVPGFALRNRKWVRLNLEQLGELQQGNDWDRLVLPSGHREMVQAMVETHTKGSQASRWADGNPQEKVEMDLVQGKGRGCIILLHGVPGVGKTSTAECVAAYTQRPLYPITCGDIGYVPEAVEKNMEQHFKLAHKWGCVLLLDEADVFLAKRNKADVKRNGLVSVFLRILEYYSGILFLTTNRVGAIDDAFRSRLHLTLYYPKLTDKQTKKIWKNNLDRIKSINQGREKNSKPPIEFDKKKILSWVKLNSKELQWNGRQIRNAFQTAVALAEFDAKHENAATGRNSRKKGNKEKVRAPGTPVMAVKHLELIADASIQFSQYLLETHGDNEDDMANRDKLRTTSFVPKVKLKHLEESESSSSSSDSSSEAEAESAAESTEESSGESEKERKKKKKMKAKKERNKESTSSEGSSDESGKEKEKKKVKKDRKEESKAKPSKEEEKDNGKEREKKKNK